MLAPRKNNKKLLYFIKVNELGEGIGQRIAISQWSKNQGQGMQSKIKKCWAIQLKRLNIWLKYFSLQKNKNKQ